MTDDHLFGEGYKSQMCALSSALYLRRYTYIDEMTLNLSSLESFRGLGSKNAYLDCSQSNQLYAQAFFIFIFYFKQNLGMKNMIYKYKIETVRRKEEISFT